VSPLPVPVAFVCDHADLGGAEHNLEVLLETFDPGWIGVVIVLEEGPFVDRLRRSGYRVEVVPTGRRLGILPGAVRLRRALRRADPAVIHANGVKAALLSVLATTGWKVPIVWLKVDLAFDGWLARWIARRCSQVVGMSKTVLQTFAGMDGDRLHVVYNGIPEIRADREQGRRLVGELIGSTGDGDVVVISGRITPGKGQLELVEAAPAILARRPGVQFAVLGAEDSFSAGHEAKVRARAAELGVAGAFHFVGNLPPDEATRFVSGCDLLVAPSITEPGGRWAEGFGLVGAEALAVGTPVVAYDSGALREVLEPCAQIVPEGDRAALAEAVVYVLEDPDERRRIVDCGRDRVRNDFSVERAASQMTERYAAAVADS
jgi:glycosyltransferase involved in cell wall biosynthesis